MDLFNDTIDTPTPELVKKTKPKQKKKGIESDLLKNLTNDFDIHSQFELAIQQRDRQALNYLLSDIQVTYHWKSKTDFINKYVGWCEKAEKKHKIFVTTHRGHCRQGGCGLNSCGGITVSVNTVFNNKPLWQFNLLYKLDKAGKIIMRRCKYFDVDTTQVG